MDKNKINKIFLIIGISFLTYLIFPIHSNAYNACGAGKICNVSASSCVQSSTSYGAFESSGGKANSGVITSCSGVKDTSTTGGYHQCVTKHYLGEDTQEFNFTTIKGDKIEHTYVFVGIFNTWSLSGSGAGWNTDSAFGKPTCPGMSISYNKTQAVPSAIKGKRNLKIKSVRALSSKSDMKIFRAHKSATIEDTFYQWSVDNISSSLLSTDISDGYFSYSTSISSLGARDNSTGLGMNGRTAGHASYVRAYHYLMPYEVVFEYDNDNYDPCDSYDYAKANPGVCCAKYPETCDPCDNYIYAYSHPGTCCDKYPKTCNPCDSYDYAEANPGICCDEYPETCDLCDSYDYAKANPGTCCTKYPETCEDCDDVKYAFENPGTCCDEYPESCCSDYDVVKNNPDALAFCCNEDKHSYATHYSYPKIAIPTFYSYLDYYSEEQINEWCSPKCTREEEYDYDEDTGILSDCCNMGELGGLYGEAASAYEKYKSACVITCPISKCGNQSYFASEAEWSSCCCEEEAYKNTNKCKTTPESIWATAASCKNPSTIDDIAVGELSDEESNIQETIKFSEYNTLDKMQNEESYLLAGTGLDYEITVTHTITRSYKYEKAFDYDRYVNPTEEEIEEIEKEITEKIADDTDMEVNDDITAIKNMLKDENTTFIFKEEETGATGKYVLLNDRIDVISDGEVVEDKKIAYTYTLGDYDRDGDWYQNQEYGYLYSVPTTKKYVYKYKIVFSEKLIDKNGKIKESKEVSNKNNYINGGNKFYTETNATSGIYDFNITIKDSGITGKLSTVDDGFSCQYALVNQFTKNDTIECLNNSCENKGRGFYFRQISLSDPFPNRTETGKNWSSYYDKNTGVAKYITNSGRMDSYGSENDEKGTNVYSQDPMYRIILDTALINEVKKYNKDNGYNYDWSSMEGMIHDSLDSTSKFITKYSDKFTIRHDVNRSDKVGDF